MAFFEAAQEDRLRRERERSERALETVAAFGPLVGKASSADGSVTVECGAGGALRSLELTTQAMSGSAAHLRRDILDASKKATARANHRATQSYVKALGPSGAATADQLGMRYDAELLEDDEHRGW